MWEFLVSLFGGLFWGGKIASESAKTKIANQKLAALRISMDEWYAQVKDFAFEVSIRKRIGEDGFTEQAKEALAVIRSFPHLESANFAYGADKDSDSHIEEIVTYIQMVKHGKLSSAWVTELCRDLGPSIGTTLKKNTRIAFDRRDAATLREHGIVGAYKFR